MLQPSPANKAVYKGGDKVDGDKVTRLQSGTERPPLAPFLRNGARDLAYLAIRPHGLGEDPGLEWLVRHGTGQEAIDYVDDLIDEGSEAAALTRPALRRILELRF